MTNDEPTVLTREMLDAAFQSAYEYQRGPSDPIIVSKRQYDAWRRANEAPTVYSGH